MRSGSGDTALSAVVIIIINFDEIYYFSYNLKTRCSAAACGKDRETTSDEAHRSSAARNTLVDRQCRALSADHRLDRRRSGRL